MTFFFMLLFFGALAFVAVPEILYDRRPSRLKLRKAPPEARKVVVIRDPDLSQWITHEPHDAA